MMWSRINLTGGCNGKSAFSLAEVMVAIAVVGFLVSSTVPQLVEGIYESKWKTGYKAGIADANGALLIMLTDYEYSSLPPDYGSSYTTINSENFARFGGKLGAVKYCFDENRFDCWEQDGDCAEGEFVGIGFEDSGYCSNEQYKSFIDGKGRTWTHYSTETSVYILFDINGFARPNRLGRDRWPVRFEDRDGVVATSGIPVRAGILNDYTDVDRWCPLGNCMYRSYLTE